MSGFHRRVILKPPGLSPADTARLYESLAVAVERQQALALRSPHILPLTGPLQEDELAFFVEHEPATPLPVRALFDPDMPLPDADHVMRVSAAIVDAMRAAHAESPPLAHGSLCPGVVLIGNDGVEKITDFGFAQALHGALGDEAFLQLAVNSGADQPNLYEASGVWELLAPEVTDRDDRICSFIDPHKYGTRMFRSFEPGSDIASAGFILYLLAHHRHPYFYDDPEAHRLVEMAEFMAMNTPTSALRKDLRESEDPAIKAWAALMQRMIDRIPQNRPSARELAQSLAAVGVKPVDAAEILRRRLEVVGNRLAEQPLSATDWAEVRRDPQVIAGITEAPTDVRRKAEAFVQLVRAAETFAGDEWHQCPTIIGPLLAEADVPPPVAEKARELQAVVKQNLAIEQRLESVRARLSELDQLTPPAIASACQDLQRGLVDASADQPPHPAVAESIRQVREAIAQCLGQAQHRQNRIEQAVGEWLARLQGCLAAEQWEELAQGLGRPPEDSDWLLRDHPGVGELRAAMNKHQEEAAALERQRQQAQADLRQAEELISSDRLDSARPLIDRVAGLSMHADLVAAAEQLKASLAARKSAIAASRARVDDLLLSAEKTAAAATPEEYEKAERLCDEALKVREATPQQSERATRLRADFQQKRQALLAEKDRQARARQAAESALREAGQHLEAGRFQEARHAAESLAHSEFSDIQEHARKLLDQIKAGIARVRAELSDLLKQAGEHAGAERFSEAVGLAQRVAQHNLAESAQREQAASLIRRAEGAVRQIEQSRQQAARDQEQAVAALQGGDLAKAHQHAQAVIDNARAEPAVRQSAQEVLRDLAPLEQAQALIADRDLPAAIGILQELVASPNEATGAPARDVARRMLAQARHRQAEMVIKGIQDHLQVRARHEDRKPGIETVPPQETLGAAAPPWLMATLGTLETFLTDCTISTHPPSQMPVLSPGHRLGEKYEIVEFLGRGGMGEVYQARDLALDRRVALKIAPARAQSEILADALLNEAKAIAALNHPHILHINSFNVIEGRPCFDTTYISGQDLARYAAEHELDQRQIAQLLRPVAEALAYAHHQGVLHRDVKPQNIFVGLKPGEGPWLIDFGLARMRNILDRRANTGLCGTPGYIAPEVITSMGQEVDHRSDIFAFGCVLYGMLARRPAFFEGRSSSSAGSPPIARTLMNTLSTKARLLAQVAPNVHEELRRICEKAMAQNPRDRYQDAGDIARDLGAFLSLLEDQEARSELAAARAKFDKRRKNVPAELEDLDAASAMGKAVTRKGGETVRAEAKKFVEECARLRQSITSAQETAGKLLQLAGESLNRERWKPARDAAEEVLAVPYRPDLHEEAARIRDEAARQYKQSLAGRLKWLAIGCTAAIILGAAGYGVFFVDWRAPRATIAAAATGPTNASTAVFTVSFDEAVTGFDENAVSAKTEGAVSHQKIEVKPTDTPNTYAVTIRGIKGSGQLGLELRPGTVRDRSGNAAHVETSPMVLIDSTPPAIVKWSPATGTTLQRLDAIEVTFNEAVSGVNAGHLTVNGQAATEVRQGSSADTYTFSGFSPPHDGKVQVAMASGSIKDQAGNPFAGAAQEYEYQRFIPPLTVQSIQRVEPTEEVTGAATVKWRATFAEPINADTIRKEDFSLAIEGPLQGAQIESVGAGSATTVDVTARTGTGKGSLRLDLRAAGSTIASTQGGRMASDYTQGESYAIDRAAPAVVSSKRLAPANEQTNADSVTFRVTFSKPMRDATKKDGFAVVSPDKKISGAAVTSIAAGADGTTVDLTVSTGRGDGALRLDVLPSAGLSDALGNPLAEGYTAGETYVVDKTPPAVVSIARHDPVQEKTNAASVTWRITFSEPINAAGLSAADLTLTDSANSITGEAIQALAPTAGNTATLDVAVTTGTGNGTLRLDVPAANTHIADLFGNLLITGFTSGQVYVIEKIGPAVTVDQSPDQPDPTNSEPIRFIAVFSSPVGASFTEKGVNLGESKTAGALKAAISEMAPSNGTRFQIAVSGMSGDGDVVVVISAGAATDAAGTPNQASTSTDNRVTFDRTPPKVTDIQVVEPSQANPKAEAVVWRVQFSEEVRGIEASAFALVAASGSLENGGIESVSADRGTHVDVRARTGRGKGAWRMEVIREKAKITDRAGNGLAESFTTGASYAIDTTPPPKPRLTIAGPAAPVEQRNADIPFQVTLSGAGQQPVTVRIKPDEGVLVTGEGFDPAGRTLTFPPGTATRKLTARIDAKFPLNKTGFSLRLESPSDSAEIEKAEAQATLPAGQPATITLSTPKLELVRLTLGAGQRPIYVGPYEVTQAQFHALVSREDAAYMKLFQGVPINGPEMPMVYVNPQEAQAFCDAMNAKLPTDQKLEGYRVRLPTAAEFEAMAAMVTAAEVFANREGRDANFAGPNDAPGQTALSPGPDQSIVAAPTTKLFTPQIDQDGARIYHLFGNVWELCADGKARGGSWLDPPPGSRDKVGTYPPHAERLAPAARYPHVGFRVVYGPTE